MTTPATTSTTISTTSTTTAQTTTQSSTETINSTTAKTEEIHMERSFNTSVPIKSERTQNALKFDKNMTKLDDKISKVEGTVAGFKRNKYKSTYVGNITKPETIKVNSKLGKSGKSKSKKHQHRYLTFDGEMPRYSLGPGVKISIDMPREIVNVNLDEDYLRDIFAGRGKRLQLIAKIIPLFILPFLVQSAILPFMVSTLKLLLIKSIVVGKIAILLLILSAFKNYHRQHAALEVPYYNLVEPPSRRSEQPFYGYKVDGQTGWVN